MFTGIQENMQEQGNLLSGVHESLRVLFEKIQKAPTGSKGDNSIDSKLFIPERYSGKNDPWAVRAFVSSMDSYLALHEYSDEKKVQIFGSRLSGVARDWFDNFTRHRSGVPYSTLVIQFKLRFIPAHWESEMIAKFTRLKQTKSVRGYINIFEKLMSVLPKDVYGTRGILEHFIGGLKDPAVVRRAAPEDLRSAFYIASADEIDEGSRDHHSGRTHGHGNNYQSKRHTDNYSAANNFVANDPDAMDVDSIAPQRRRNVVCWYCHQPCHVQRDCPEKAKNGSGRQ